MTDLNKTGTFAATTNGNFNAIPYYRAKSFRVTNFTGKVVGIRQRHKTLVVDDFNDTDFTEWTGDIQYESAELEGTGAARVIGSSYRSLTTEVMLNGSEVEFSFVTPSVSPYSLKFSVYDDPARIGMSNGCSVTVSESNSKSNTKYKVTICMYPILTYFDAYLEEEGQDRVQLIDSQSAQFGSNNMINSIVAIEPSVHVVVDPIIYQQKVNYSNEQIGHGGSYTYPCDNNTSEYEIINLGSDVMNYSDNNQTISISGFYAR